MDKRRLFTVNPRFQVSREAGKPVTLVGYAIVWNAISSDRGGYKVRMLPNSASFTDPTHALLNHDYSHVIGNTANGSLRIKSDDYGARVEIDLPDTNDGRDAAVIVETKLVDGMSFTWASDPVSSVSEVNGQTILDVSSVLVDEVTITAIPAFVEASIAVKADPDFTRRRHHALNFQRLRLAALKSRMIKPSI